MPKDVQDFLIVLRYLFMSVSTLFIIIEDKGGVGKSLIAQILAALLMFDGKDIVQMVDTDHSNSTTSQIHADTQMLDLRERVSRGVVANLLQKFVDQTVKHIVMDVGAREESSVTAMLPWIAGMMRNIGGRVVVIRPVTLGSHNQRNAVAFLGIAEENSIPVVFVRNEGQGRLPEYFDRWQQTKSRANALERGAVETYLPDGDIRYADEAIGYGLTIADVALRDFSKVSEADAVEAKLFFNNDVCAFLNIWLRESMANFGNALQEAIAKRERLDAVKTSEVVTETPTSRGRKGR